MLQWTSIHNTTLPVSHRPNLGPRVRTDPGKNSRHRVHHDRCIHCCAKRGSFQDVRQGIAGLAAAGLLSLSTMMLGLPPPAHAVLVSPNAGIARTAGAALRRSIPATNKDVKDMQRNLEDIAFKLRIPQRKPYQQMLEDLVRVTQIANDESKVFVGVPQESEQDARHIVDEIKAGLIKIKGAIDAKDADKTSMRTAEALQNVAALEIIQAPGLPFTIPRDLQSFPRLLGRATIELTFDREGQASRFIDKRGGGGVSNASVVLVIDGYSAPITAGNFVQNVMSGAYDGAPVTVGGETISITSKTLQGGVLPMEMLPLGEFDPVYKSILDVQGGELPVLPLSIYGAVAMAYPETPGDDGYVAANEFFLYKFDKSSSGLSGLSFEEGVFPVFGYVTKGGDIMPQLQSGDKVTAAKLLAGGDRLLVPSEKAA